MADWLDHRHHPVKTQVAAMPPVARVAYIPLRALALNVIAIYSRSHRKRRKPDSMTTVDPRVERLYSLDELTELRRNTLRYARKRGLIMRSTSRNGYSS